MRSPYGRAVRKLLDDIESSQSDAIGRAADLAIHALTHRGALFCAEIGHGIQGDFLNRAGGLAALHQFGHAFSVQDTVAACLSDRETTARVHREVEAIRLAVTASNLREGDVVYMGSVSGRNVQPVALALACREVGVRTVGLTSFAYSAETTSLHPSGLRLREAVDVAVDICAPYGDAGVEIDGIDTAVLPLSGIAFSFTGWLIWEQVMVRMAAAGTPPTVFMSVNRSGGKEFYEAARKRFDDQGY
ncbi:MAG: sugar isomerase domain-containing protein [Chthonomonadales bacterium]|nr:sugar isomerase domain-containing protein [Chthonomonadales bacterium]